LNLDGRQMPSVEDRLGPGVADTLRRKLSVSSGASANQATASNQPPVSSSANEGPVFTRVLSADDLRRHVNETFSSGESAGSIRDVIASISSQEIKSKFFEKVIAAAAAVTAAAAAAAADSNDNRQPSAAVDLGSYTEKHMSFYPDCPEQSGIILETQPAAAGYDEYLTRLHFSSLKAPPAGKQIKILTGDLNLYFKNQQSSSIDAVLTADSTLEHQTDSGNQIRVTIHMKSMQNGVEKLEMLDSAMVDSASLGTGHWIKFDIRGAVQRWVQNPAQNLGLFLEVEDQERNRVAPTQFFQMMECQNGSKARHPFPRAILGDLSRELLSSVEEGGVASGEEEEEGESSPAPFLIDSLNVRHFPILDIGSIQIETDDEEEVARIDGETTGSAAATEEEQFMDLVADIPHIRHNVPFGTVSPQSNHQGYTADEETQTDQSSGSEAMPFRLENLGSINYLSRNNNNDVDDDHIINGRSRHTRNHHHNRHHHHHQRHERHRHHSGRPFKLEKLEERNFLSSESQSNHHRNQPHSNSDDLPFVEKQVVMTRAELVQTLAETLQEEESSISHARQLFNRLVQNANDARQIDS